MPWEKLLVSMYMYVFFCVCLCVCVCACVYGCLTSEQYKQAMICSMQYIISLWTKLFS